LAPLFPGLEILEVAGHGGMGTIYKARQPQLDRTVALKILSPELGPDPAFAQRFSHEAQALAKLNHSNIVRVFDFGRAGEFYYFLMEYVDGVTLRTLIDQKALHAEEAQRIVIEICHALQYAHEEGIVHGDIKPSNILLDKKGRVKIADFGLARLRSKGARDTSGAGHGTMVMGTPDYMAPEQTQKPGKVDHRADIYAVGVVFYEMLTGELPVGRFEPPSRKSDADPRLDKVASRALEKATRRRYQNAGDLRRAVETVTGHFHNLPGDVPRRSGGRKWRWLGRFILVVVPIWLAALSYLLLKDRWADEKTVLIPAEALQAFAANPEGLGVGRRIISALRLDKEQSQNVNTVLRRYEREFLSLERRHSTRSRDAGGHLHVTIQPFPQEMNELMKRMWADLGTVLSPAQIATAKTLHFERFFPHTGTEPIRVEIWQAENGEYHYVQGQAPAGKSAAASGPLPRRLRNWLLRENQESTNAAQ
jgi:serine/threonine protein kinase